VYLVSTIECIHRWHIFYPPCNRYHFSYILNIYPSSLDMNLEDAKMWDVYTHAPSLCQKMWFAKISLHLLTYASLHWSCCTEGYISPTIYNDVYARRIWQLLLFLKAFKDVSTWFFLYLHFLKYLSRWWWLH